MPRFMRPATVWQSALKGCVHVCVCMCPCVCVCQPGSGLQSRHSDPILTECEPPLHAEYMLFSWLQCQMLFVIMDRLTSAKERFPQRGVSGARGEKHAARCFIAARGALSSTA